MKALLSLSLFDFGCWTVSIEGHAILPRNLSMGTIAFHVGQPRTIASVRLVIGSLYFFIDSRRSDPSLRLSSIP